MKYLAFLLCVVSVLLLAGDSAYALHLVVDLRTVLLHTTNYIRYDGLIGLSPLKNSHPFNIGLFYLLFFSYHCWTDKQLALTPFDPARS